MHWSIINATTNTHSLLYHMPVYNDADIFEMVWWHIMADNDSEYKPEYIDQNHWMIEDGIE